MGGRTNENKDDDNIENVSIDDEEDAINMSELEELMDDLSIEEEIDDEISASDIRHYTHN